MKHPLEFIPARVRKSRFLAFLVWTLVLFALMQVLNRPLVTDAAPSGIVSFELAGTPEHAFQIMVSWSHAASDRPLINAIKPLLYAAFGLGFDYLFMPSYAIAIALGVLLASGRHKGWFTVLGMWIGWGSLAAALFDATENLALWKILLGEFESAWPSVAAVCATIKFGLIGLGIGYALLGVLLPRSR
jgi:hypothetical protein